jgi:hypothetical protein
MSVCDYVRARSHSILGAFAFVSTIAAAGCFGDRVVEPARDGDVLLTGQSDFSSSLGRPVPIDFDTYERSQQVVHPSAVAFPSEWHGQRYWLALTPYPNSDSRVENPSLFTSETGDSWGVPAGAKNPIAETTHGYLSDPDLAYDPASDELRLYYREVSESRGKGKHAKPRHKADVVYLTRSSDGRQWSAPKAIFSDVGRFVVSPTVSRGSDGDWKMWSVDAGRQGCNASQTRITLRHSADGINWTRASALSFLQPGYLPWHLDVQYVPQLNAYWALVAAYPANSACTASSLFLATSTDGVKWTTYPSPVLARGALPQFAMNVYRSTFAFAPDGNTLTIWLTGARTVRRGDRKNAPTLYWSAAVWHTHADALLEHVRVERKALVSGDTEPSYLRRLAVENTLP